MTPADFDRLLEDVVALPPEERDAFLDRQGLDSRVRRRIQDILVLEDRLLQLVGKAAVNAVEGGGAEPSFSGTERFKVQKYLGRGGFGMVYQVKDKDRNAVLALKVLSHTGPESIERFKHEFREPERISHPNLVSLYELFSQGDCWFFTMEFIDGVDFVTYNQSEQGFERLRRTLPQLVAGVRALHKAGKIHRDLKPHNILVSHEGRVVILDFGLATDISGAESEGHGTREFMSPEQANRQTLSRASDWYSVGVILYLCLTGRMPARDGGGSLTSVSQLRSDAPADLGSVCMKLLDPDPALRPGGEEIERLFGIASPDVTETRGTAGRPLPLVGRENHLVRLREAMNQAVGGRPTTVLMHGDSGVGKTALALRFLEEIRVGGNCLVIEARCHVRESIPYKTIGGLLDSLKQHLRTRPETELGNLIPPGFAALTHLFPTLRNLDIEAKHAIPRKAADSQSLRSEASQALCQLLTGLSQRKPVVVWIDDLQWGDSDSAPLLLDLLSSRGPLPILFLLTYRRNEVRSSQILKTVLHSATADRIDLPVDPLDHASACQLATELLRRSASPADLAEPATRLATESGGNPFFLAELAKHSQTLATRSGAGLEELIRLRAARLPEPARRLLEVVALAGQPLDLTIAGAAARLDTGAYPEISHLRVEQLIRTRSTGAAEEIEPYHDRVRESIEGGLKPEISRQYHRQLAQAGRSSGKARARFLAFHFWHGGAGTEAFDYAMRAGEDAEGVSAYEAAVECYRLAIELAFDDIERMRPQIKLSLALYYAGYSDEGSKFYFAAAAQAARGPMERSTFDQIVNIGLGPPERSIFEEFRPYYSSYQFTGGVEDQYSGPEDFTTGYDAEK